MWALVVSSSHLLILATSLGDIIIPLFRGTIHTQGGHLTCSDHIDGK